MRADERVQRHEQGELAGVGAQAEPDRRAHAGAATRPERLAATICSWSAGGGGIVGQQRVGELLRIGEREHAVVGALEADRGDRVAGEAAAADRAAVVARVDDDVVGQLEQAPQAPVQQPRLAAASPATCRSGRPTSPIRSESPLKTSHGSSLPRRRSATA